MLRYQGAQRVDPESDIISNTNGLGEETKTNSEENNHETSPPHENDDDEGSDEFNDSESEDGGAAFHDAPVGEHLDYVAFYLANPLSEEFSIQIPLWLVSVQGFHRNRIRISDHRYLDKLPRPLIDAVMNLRETLDPLDMDFPLPTISPNWCRVITSFIAAFFVRLFRSLKRYFRNEWQRYIENLEALRGRDWPGYLPSPVVAAPNETIEDDDAGPHVPECLPSMKNLQTLLEFNRLAQQHQWFGTLVRTEKTVPGSRIIGFRLQLSKIDSAQLGASLGAFFPDASPVGDHRDRRVSLGEDDVEDYAQAKSRELFDDIPLIDVSDRASDTHETVASIPAPLEEPSKATKSTYGAGLMLHSIFHHLHRTAEASNLPPVLLYRVEGRRDIPLSSPEVLSYVSSIGVLDNLI